MAVATIWFFLLEWWSTAGATILSERVGGLEIRQLERRDLHELPYNWCRHCGVKKSYAAALSTKEYTPGAAEHKPSKAVHHRSPSKKHQVAAQLQSVCGKDQARTDQHFDAPSAGSSCHAEVTKQIKHVE